MKNEVTGSNDHEVRDLRWQCQSRRRNLVGGPMVKAPTHGSAGVINEHGDATVLIRSRKFVPKVAQLRPTKPLLHVLKQLIGSSAAGASGAKYEAPPSTLPRRNRARTGVIGRPP